MQGVFSNANAINIFLMILPGMSLPYQAHVGEYQRKEIVIFQDLYIVGTGLKLAWNGGLCGGILLKRDLCHFISIALELAWN